MRRDYIHNAIGGNGFRGLTRVLTILDDNGNRKLDKYEIDNGLQTYGLSLLPEELDAIMKAFDDDGNGQISVREFMRALRGPMSDRRVNLVRLAYAQLDIDGNETVTFDEIRQLYDVKKHPDVLSHNKTPDMVCLMEVHGSKGEPMKVFLSQPFECFALFRDCWHMRLPHGMLKRKCRLWG